MFNPEACLAAASRLRSLAWWLAAGTFFANVARGFAIASTMPPEAGGSMSPPALFAVVMSLVDGIVFGGFLWLTSDVAAHAAEGIASLHTRAPAEAKPSPAREPIAEAEPAPAPRKPMAPLRPSSNQSSLPPLPGEFR